jgi:hypothetical protein
MFYSVKLTWQQPKPASDQMVKTSKNFLVYAESVTEAELRVNEWTPANYQDAVVDEVKKTQIIDLGIEGGSEVFWILKLIIDDGSERQKPFVVVLNGMDLEDIVKKVKAHYSDCEVLAVQKYTVIIDEDLISTETRKLTTIEGEIDS